MKRIFWILIFLFSMALPGQTVARELPDKLFEVKLVGERVDFSFVGNPAQLFIRHWLPGEVILEGGQTRKVEALLYNGFHDELVYMAENKQYIMLEKSRLKGFVLDNHLVNETLYFEKITLPANTPYRKGIFAQVLHKGEVKLYAHRSIKSGGREIVHQREGMFEHRLYKPDTSYLLQLPDGTWHSFNQLRRNTLQDLFPALSDQIRSIQRSNHIRMRNNEQELIRLVRLLEGVL